MMTAPLLPGLEEAIRGAVTVEGLVKKVRMTRGDFRILEVEVERGGRHVIETWVGEVISMTPGQRVRGTGHYETHREWGEQFRADVIVPVIPTTRRGIIEFLGSGAIEGLGPVFAAAIVDHFEKRGEDVLAILDTAPERVEEVTGIGPEKTEKIVRGWRTSRAIAGMMIFLQGHGASPSLASNIVRHYVERGEDPLTVVQTEPYRLALEVHRIGFDTADALARSVGGRRRLGPARPGRRAASAQRDRREGACLHRPRRPHQPGRRSHLAEEPRRFRLHPGRARGAGQRRQAQARSLRRRRRIHAFRAPARGAARLRRLPAAALPG